MKDWIDKLTPDEARAFMRQEIKTKDEGRDGNGRRRRRLVNPISFRDLSRIKVKADT